MPPPSVVVRATEVGEGERFQKDLWVYDFVPSKISPRRTREYEYCL